MTATKTEKDRAEELTRIGYEYCHFKKMDSCASDSDDIGNFESWLECSFCGHTKPDCISVKA